MRSIGFSTGALALGDFNTALAMLEKHQLRAVELSALRDRELLPLMQALSALDLKRYKYVSVHVPSKFTTMNESEVAKALEPCVDLRIPIVLHPDAIRDVSCWRRFGTHLCIENMDKRKHTGRTSGELLQFFDVFPEASLCFDIAHARQIDPTMGEARDILKTFGRRLRQIHISELDASGHHHGLSMATVLASRRLLSLIKEEVPAIIESQIDPANIDREVDLVESALSQSRREGEWQGADWGSLA